MKGFQGDNLLAAGALVLSAGWVFAWSAGWLAGQGSWTDRLGLLALGCALAGGSGAVWVHCCRRRRRQVQRYLDAICRLAPERVVDGNALADLPPLRDANPWAGTVQRVREAFLERGRQLQELDHARTATEIRARRAAAESEQIREILSGLGEPVLAVDEYNELVLANHSAESLFGFKVETAETRVLERLVDCQRLVELLTRTRRRRAGGDRSDEIEIPDADGRSRWYRVTATKLTTGAGLADRQASASSDSADRRNTPLGAVAVLRDIGDQKALQKRNAEFVSAVSHEMKTPLAGIKAYVELVADGDAEDEQTREEFLKVINDQTDRLQRLVDNLLNLARIEAGVINVSKQTRSLNELLEEALRVVQPSAEAKQIELIADLSPMYLGVLVDRDMLLQAAINLLSNAIKYTPKGGRVSLRSRMEDNQVRFEVQDTGVGLSAEDCRRVFEKFYRVGKDKSMASGTGLGLPLAKHIVEDVHGGQLWADSVLGQGSTFAVTLPGAGQLT